MTRKIAIYLVVIGLSVCFLSFNSYGDSDKNYLKNNILIFKDTPAWKLAVTVKIEDIESLSRIVKENPSLLNYQEPNYGVSILLWAVGVEKYKSAETLLKYGADPNIPTKLYGETPLFLASGVTWNRSKYSFYGKDLKAINDPKYVNLLLRYSADPNKNYIGTDNTIIEPGFSPLMNSIGNGIEKTKALVDAGADVNYKTPKGRTAAIESLIFPMDIEYAYYLIVTKKAKITEPCQNFYPVDLLRKLKFKIDSKGYKLKLDIIDEFKQQGVNY